MGSLSDMSIVGGWECKDIRVWGREGRETKRPPSMESAVNLVLIADYEFTASFIRDAAHVRPPDDASALGQHLTALM